MARVRAVQSASGFALALRLTHEAYGAVRGWPPIHAN